MSISKNKLRIGNFTSSEIFKLMTLSKDKKNFGEPAFTYIEETNFERKLGRSLDDEANAKPLTWGKLIEGRAFEMLGLDYSLTSEETVQHPTISYWAGSKDGIRNGKNKSVIDIKSPFTLKSFCQLVKPIYDGLTGMNAMNYIRENHKDGKKYYWQLVSNAILDGVRSAELVVYMPYFSELAEIKMMAGQVAAEDMHKHYWIFMAMDDELPFLPDNGYYKNINTIPFVIPEEDIQLVTNNVKKAGEMLINNGSVVICKNDEELETTIVEDANALKI